MTGPTYPIPVSEEQRKRLEALAAHPHAQTPQGQRELTPSINITAPSELRPMQEMFATTPAIDEEARSACALVRGWSLLAQGRPVAAIPHLEAAASLAGSEEVLEALACARAAVKSGADRDPGSTEAILFRTGDRVRFKDGSRPQGTCGDVDAEIASTDTTLAEFVEAMNEQYAMNDPDFVPLSPEELDLPGHAVCPTVRFYLPQVPPWAVAGEVGDADWPKTEVLVPCEWHDLEPA